MRSSIRRRALLLCAVLLASAVIAGSRSSRGGPDGAAEPAARPSAPAGVTASGPAAVTSGAPRPSTPTAAPATTATTTGSTAAEVPVATVDGDAAGADAADDGAGGGGAAGDAARRPPPGAPVVRLAPGDDAQRVVDAAPAGAVIVLATGVHQGFSVQPRPGQFFQAEPGAVLDGGGTAADAFHAFGARADIPNGVVISGAGVDARLEIRNYAGRLQTGAVHPHVDTRPELGMARDWTVQWCDIHSNAATGIRTADGMTVRQSVVHHNGQLGIGGTGRSVRIVDNEIAYNRTRDDVDPTWEGGGVKLVGTTDARVVGNRVHGNRGNGLWTDIDAVGTLTAANTVTDNELAGIFDEISYGAEIRDNVVAGNGTVDSGWYWNAGIQIAASRNVVVAGNQLSGNRQGIMLIQQRRGAGNQGTYVLDAITVQGNVLQDNGPTGAVRDTDVFDPFAAAIHFADNRYGGASDGNFVWNDAELDTASWQDVGHDR